MPSIRLSRLYAALLCMGVCIGALAAPMAPLPATTGVHGLDVEGMDNSVAPGNDFYAYANGSWVKNTPIADDRSSNSVGLVLTELTNKRTEELIKQLSKKQLAEGSEAAKIRDYYLSYLDVESIDSKGLAPLSHELHAIEAIANKQQLAHALGSTLRADVDVMNATNFYTDNLFGLWVAQDMDNPKRYLPFLLQGGLGMPDREYYLDDSPRMAEIRNQYQIHIGKMLKLANIENADEKAGQIYALELAIAQAHWSRVESEDAEKGDNHWKLSDFEKNASGLDWKEFFKAAQMQSQNEFVVWQPSAFTGIAKLVSGQSLETWKSWLTFKTIEHNARFLPSPFVDERFSFYGQALTGANKLLDRWKRGIDFTNTALGQAVGKLYVKQYFPPSEKARAAAMVQDILAAFKVRIDKLDWMTDATKKRAKAKLAALKVGVGYPDKWIDYTSLKIIRGDALGNFQRSERFEYARNIHKLGKPVDRSEWVMNPQLVNAVNLPVMNSMNFPAAILQPPYFDAQNSAAANYGSIGATIGHEISHSFDNLGALFDETGRMKNWWTPEDFAHFQASGEQLSKQYDAYHPFPDLAINGKQVLGENIADLAGLAAAYDAYRLTIKKQPATVIQGFTGDQQFFISFAQSWRSKSREKAMRQQVLTNEHAPGEYRALTVRNIDAWYNAFNIAPDQTLYLSPDARVRVW